MSAVVLDLEAHRRRKSAIERKLQHRRYWRMARDFAQGACRSPALLAYVRENYLLDDLVAWLTPLGDSAGQKIFRETVIASGALDEAEVKAEDVDYALGRAWYANHQPPGDVRDLLRHVDMLEGTARAAELPDPPSSEGVRYRRAGMYALAREIDAQEAAREAGKTASSATPWTPGDLVLVQASGVKLKKYDWLWPGFLVRGKFHVIAGKPSGGKTTLVLKCMAIVSSSGVWPDGTRAEIGKVLMWSGEDDINDTLVPRLKAMGANLDNIYFIDSVVDGITAKRRPFDPAQDMEALKRAAKSAGDISLIVVDPVVSAVAGDSHKNAEVRRGLQPLVDLAQECNAALVGISHFTKGTGGQDPVERVTGSLAFGAIARIVFAVAKRVDEESNETERIFVRAKSNIGPSDGGFKFIIDKVRLPAPDDMDATAVTWGEPLEGTARDLLKEAEGAGESTKTEDAAELIQETMRTKGGEASTTDLHEALKGAGIGRDSRYRAIDGLLTQHRIARVRYTENGAWTYIFPRRGGVADVSAFDPTASDSAANGDLTGEVKP